MSRNYNKDLKQMLLGKIKLLREAGLKWTEVEDEILTNYAPLPFKFKTLRLEFQESYKFDENRVDKDKVYLNIAKSRNQLATEKKILIKQRNSLNNELNVQAFRQMIIDELSLKDFNSSYKRLPIVNKKEIIDKVVYIISDEHYKGIQDADHLRSIYANIKEDIDSNKNSRNTSYELWFLGDGIDGLIHTGSLAQNDGSIGPMLDYCNICIDCINQLPIFTVRYVCKSNHTQTRPLGTSRNELAREDLGFVICELFKRGLRKDIKFYSDDVIKYYDNDWKLNIALLHGHQPYAKSKDKMVEYWSSKYNFIPDIIFMGHYHTFKVNEFGVNKYLCVAPTAKRFCGDYETENGYISTAQIIKLSVKNKQPIFNVINITESVGQ